MINITKNEMKILLLLFKRDNEYYNSNNLSKEVGVSRVGTMKIFKKLYSRKIVISQKIGKSIIYKLNVNDNYVSRLIAFLLASEADVLRRWKEEFKDLYKEGRVVILFGSIIKNYDVAKDIDLMIITDRNDEKEINSILVEKQKVLTKKLHSIILSSSEFVDSVNKKNKAILDILKNSIILYGQDKYVEVIKDVTRFKSS